MAVYHHDVEGNLPDGDEWENHDDERVNQVDAWENQPFDGLVISFVKVIFYAVEKALFASVGHPFHYWHQSYHWEDLHVLEQAQPLVEEKLSGVVVS